MRYALEVQYRGKNYAGSQIQFEGGKQIEEPTIQGELEKALRTLIKSDSDVADKIGRKIAFYKPFSYGYLVKCSTKWDNGRTLPSCYLPHNHKLSCSG